MTETRNETLSGYEWIVAYEDDEPAFGYVPDRDTGGKVIEVVRLEGEYAAKLGDKYMSDFMHSFNDAVDAAHEVLYMRPELDNRAVWHEITGEDGIYLVGRDDTLTYVVNAFRSSNEPGYVNFGVHGLNVEREYFETYDSGLYNGYTSIEDCVRDLVSEHRLLDTPTIEFLCPNSMELDDLDDLAYALGEEGLESAVFVPDKDVSTPALDPLEEAIRASRDQVEHGAGDDKGKGAR